jgi:hypothetical protein
LDSLYGEVGEQIHPGGDAGILVGRVPIELKALYAFVEEPLKGVGRMVERAVLWNRNAVDGSQDASA